MAAAFFRSGAWNVPAGATQVTLTGLSIPFTPAGVIVGLRQPEGDSADIIAAHVAGTPTADGFTAILSAPTPTTGYILDWTAFCAELDISSADTLAVSYDDLFKTVSDFLGYGTGTLDEARTAEVDSCIQAGVRQFYWPPATEMTDGSHDWSFLKVQGSIQLTQGVSTYNLPDGFGRIFGHLRYSPDAHRPSIPVIPIGQLHPCGESRWPRFAAVTWRSAIGAKGQLKQIHFDCAPADSALLFFSADADTGPLSSDMRPYPLGGAMHSELVVESCLAIAEQRRNDEQGVHTQNFARLLAAAISRDRREGPQNYGLMRHPSDILPDW